jgi:hypothetical protein
MPDIVATPQATAARPKASSKGLVLDIVQYSPPLLAELADRLANVHKTLRRVQTPSAA